MKKKQQILSLFLLVLIIIQIFCSNLQFNEFFYPKKNNDEGSLNYQDVQDIKKNWTILIYLDGDNNLEYDAIRDFLEMSSIGSDENINIIVQFDRISDYNNYYDDWTTTKRFFITKGMIPNSNNAIMDLGELNMGDPKTLTDFILWGVNLYSSEYYALIIWDHGDGWESLSNDYTNDNDFLTISELGSALSNAGHIFDLVGFDACKMSMAEVHTQIKDWAKLCVSSQNLESISGWPYNTILTDLAENPNMLPSDFGKIIVNRYYEYYCYYQYYYDDYSTLSLVNLSQYNLFIQSINDFSNILIEEYDNIFQEIHFSRLKCVDQYMSAEYVDLYHFVEEIYKIVQNPTVKSSANNLMALIEVMILENCVINPNFNLNGIGVYFPINNFDYNYKSISFSELTIWNEFLECYYGYRIIDDNYEDNDNRDSAYNLISNRQKWLSSLQGLGYQRDEDWYRIQVNPEENTLILKLNFTHSIDYIGITLYNENGRIVKNRVTSSNNIYFTIILMDGIYLIKIDGNNGGNPYDLFWNSSMFIGDDNYEDNDNYSDSYDLDPFENKDLYMINGSAIQADDDWYRININVWYEKRVVINLYYNNDFGNIDIDLYNSSLFLIDQAISDSNDEKLELTVPNTGIYYIKIYGENQTNVYNLKWDSIEDDIFESNNEYNSSFNLSSYKDQWTSYWSREHDVLGDAIYGYQWDNDWYCVQIDSNYSRLSIDVKNLYADITRMRNWYLRIEIYNITDNSLKYLTGTSSSYYTLNIDYIIKAPGIYYFLIMGENKGAKYDLRWGIYSPNDDKCEENDNSINAFDISENEQMWLSDIKDYGIQSDDDWYKIYVDDGEEYIRIKLFAMMTQYSQFFIDLYYENLTLVQTQSTYTVMGYNNYYPFIIDQKLNSSGYYLIKIYGNNNSDIYDLWWNDVPVINDKYEENNNFETAYDISGNEGIWLKDINGLGVILEDDEDWYEIYISPEEEYLYVNLTFSRITGGDLDLGLYDINGNLIKKEDIYDDYEFMSLFLPSGKYYLLVSSGNYGIEYNLYWDDVQNLVDDNYENNDNYTTAFPLKFNKYLYALNGFGIQIDDDWYLIDLIEHDWMVYIINIQVLYNNSRGNIYVELYNSSHYLVASDYSSSGNIYLNDLAINQKCYLRIFGENKSVIYNVKYDIVQYEDCNELNNDYTQAHDIVESEDIRCYQNDDDWYKINITHGYQYLHIRLLFESYEGYLNLNIFDENLLFIKNYSIIHSYDYQYFYQFLPSEGIYYIQFNGSNTGEYYRFCCNYLENPPNDNYENNNDFDTAFDLSRYRRTWLSSINGSGTYLDNDWFKFNITSDEKLLILKLTYLFTMGNLNIVLYNSSHHLIQYNISENNDIYWKFNLSSKGIYYLEINGSYGLYYDLWWDDVENDIPIILNISPKNESFGIRNQILLNFTLFDSDGDLLNVHIYNAKEHKKMYSIFGIHSNSSYTYLWDDLSTQQIYSWFILVDDGLSQVSSSFLVFLTCLPPNQPESPTPSVGAIDIGLDPELCISISDPDSDFLNISFYNAFDDSLIDTLYNVNNNTEISLIWKNLSEGTFYEWYVIIDDGFFQIKSQIWSFKTINIENNQYFPLILLTISMACILGAGGGLYIIFQRKKAK
ncbi:MAG: hypothetical protein JXA99_12980 [Candidatus Lokiarchaeota archaeon]|nr:hypothetical protein [Candidatus Lokiarchaeota archaeon]